MTIRYVILVRSIRNGGRGTEWGGATLFKGARTTQRACFTVVLSILDGGIWVDAREGGGVCTTIKLGMNIVRNEPVESPNK